MPAVVPGQTFEVKTTFVNRGGVNVKAASVTLDAKPGWNSKGAGAPADARNNQPLYGQIHRDRASGGIADAAAFRAEFIQEAVHRCGSVKIHRPSADAAITAVAR